MATTTYSGFNTAQDVVGLPDGSAYVSDRGTQCIAKIAADGTVTHSWVSLGNNNFEITADGNGNLYVAARISGGGRVYKITPAGVVTSVDVGTNDNWRIAYNQVTNSVWLQANGTNGFWEITPSLATTFHSFSSATGSGDWPCSIAVDQISGTVYGGTVSDIGVVKLPAGGSPTLMPISPSGSYSAPWITVGTDGNIYAASWSGGAITKITSAGTATTGFASAGTASGWGWIGTGPAGGYVQAGSEVKKVAYNGTVSTAFTAATVNIVGHVTADNIVWATDMAGNVYKYDTDYTPTIVDIDSAADVAVTLTPTFGAGEAFVGPLHTSTAFAETLLAGAFGPGAGSTAPATYFVGLSTTEPRFADASGTLVNVGEPSGGGYARASVTNASGFAVVAREASNTTEIAFPTATGSWGEVGWVVIYDAATGGTPLVACQITPATVDSGKQVRVAPGALTVTLPAG